jgi:signal transduction histidine kinase/CheY-like chemotaxis protein
MQDLITFMANLDALAFLVLGVVVGAAWLRNRDRSTGWLALAIVLLSLVSLLGRLPSLIGFTPPLMSQLSLIAFVGSGYSLLRYRSSLIPLSPAWHAVAAIVLGGSVVAYFVTAAFGASQTVLLWIAIVLLVGWAAAVGEPIFRFWLVSRGLPAVQAWRLRSLCLGFAGIVLLLLFVVALVGAGARTTSPGVQLGTQVLILFIVPLLYASFSPPAWLRREWRSAEEEGLRAFMEGMLMVDEDSATLNQGALHWAARITGAGAAASFDSHGDVRASLGLEAGALADLREHVLQLSEGADHYELDGHGTSLATVPIVSPDGTGRLVLVSGPFSPGFGSDELSRVKQFMTAVTAGSDRKRLIEELKEANVMLKEASEHKSVFLANMSHELRTPLNAIIGFSELLLDAKESQFDAATQKRFLGQVHHSGKHLLGLINDILDLSKVEAGQMELRLQLVPVEPVVAQVVSIVEPLAGQKKIKIESDVASAGVVTADAGKLKQMLLNLVSNAIKFTPERGTVTITARRLRSAVEISVADTGIGISVSDQTQIFHEFHQVDPGPGRQQQGTGLGLALTRRFALLHGGEVMVRSKVGEGSVFTLRLPVQPAVEELAAPVLAPTKDPLDASRPLVLVIEDDASAAELLTRQLQAGGFRTEIARTGTEAVAKARALRPAAITLDILLPELDGWEVITRLKREEETSDIPVIVVSVVDNIELGKALGALDYFVKPVDGRELVDRLARFKLQPSAKNGATRVLVVDDEAANRTWLSRILEPAGFHVVIASGDREAIELAKADPPDLVLLDLMMPEVTGFDVVEALRADPRTEDTPIMILTARHLTEADKRHLNGHVSTILSRGSVGASDLLGLLHQVVEKRAAPTV